MLSQKLKVLEFSMTMILLFLQVIDFKTFKVLGDGIFDKMTSSEVLATIWKDLT